jgi:hypothetical protein
MGWPTLDRPPAASVAAETACWPMADEASQQGRTLAMDIGGCCRVSQSGHRSECERNGTVSNKIPISPTHATFTTKLTA